MHSPDDTQPFEGTPVDDTRALDTPGTMGDPGAGPIPGSVDDPGTSDDPHLKIGPKQPPNPDVIRPTGISWVTVSIGGLCLGLAALILIAQTSDLSIPWSVAAPALVISVGAILVLVGAVSLAKGRSNGHTSPR